MHPSLKYALHGTIIEAGQSDCLPQGDTNAAVFVHCDRHSLQFLNWNPLYREVVILPREDHQRLLDCWNQAHPQPPAA